MLCEQIFFAKKNNMNEVNRDSRMNVHKDNDWKAFLNIFLFKHLYVFPSAAFFLPGICGHCLERGTVHGAPGSAGAFCIQLLPRHNGEGQQHTRCPGK